MSENQHTPSGNESNSESNNAAGEGVSAPQPADGKEVDNGVDLGVKKNPEPPQQIDTTPLCVDLDGTLIQSDLSFESALRAIKIRPWILLFFPFWLRKGLGYFKSQIARIARLNYDTIPLNASVLRYVKEKKRAGRPILLVTGSYQVYARSMAETLGIFDEVLATTIDCNLTGQNKARVLVERFGEGGFDYIGNEVKDRHIWQVSRRALMANATPKLLDKLSFIDFYRVFHTPENSLRNLLKACQANKWSKNLLLLIAPLMNLSLFSGWNAVIAFAAFVSFCLVASATYFFNDLCDLDDDRSHPKKRKRPVASGQIGLRQAVVMMLLLLAAGLAIGACLPTPFFWSLLFYMIGTLAYSFKLKRMVTVDVITLAALYSVRILAGALALNLPVTFWLIAFSSFFFLGLSLAKRVAELTQLEQRKKQYLYSKHLTIEDKAALSQCGTASSFLALFVLALSLNDSPLLALYAHPQLLWLLCPMLLYWTTRLWIKTNRGQLHEGPIVFAAKDKTSLTLGAAALALLYLAGSAA